MDAVDTNFLVYAHDPRDPAKQDRAVEIIASLYRRRAAVAGGVRVRGREPQTRGLRDEPAAGVCGFEKTAGRLDTGATVVGGDGSGRAVDGLR